MYKQIIQWILKLTYKFAFHFFCQIDFWFCYYFFKSLNTRTLVNCGWRQKQAAGELDEFVWWGCCWGVIPHLLLRLRSRFRASNVSHKRRKSWPKRDTACLPHPPFSFRAFWIHFSFTPFTLFCFKHVSRATLTFECLCHCKAVLLFAVLRYYW